MPWDAAFPAQSTFSEEQSIAHWSSPYPPSFFNSPPSGVCRHHGSGLLSACPGCLPQRPGLSPYLCSHSTVWHCGPPPTPWEISSSVASRHFFSGHCMLVSCRDILDHRPSTQLLLQARPKPRLVFPGLVSHASLSWMAQSTHGFHSLFMLDRGPKPRPLLWSRTDDPTAIWYINNHMQTMEISWARFQITAIKGISP